MTSTLSSARSASKPHENAAKREQNPHYRHYNGLTPWSGARVGDHVGGDEPIPDEQHYH